MKTIPKNFTILIIGLGILTITVLMLLNGDDLKAPEQKDMVAEIDKPAELVEDSKDEPATLTERKLVDLVPLEVEEVKIEEQEAFVDVIDPAARRRAQFFVGMIEQAIATGMADRWRQNNNIESRTQLLLDAMSVRLNLTEEQQLAFQNILMENMLARQDPFRSNPELFKQVLAEERDLMIDGVALKIMEREGELTEAQSAYGDQMKAKFTELLGFDPEAHESAPRWLNDEEALASMSANLLPEQQEEFDLYVEEKITREAEQAAFQKSNKLANTLGLSNDDRDVLFQFYYEKPDATNEDLKEVLDPALHSLLDKEQK